MNYYQCYSFFCDTFRYAFKINISSIEMSTAKLDMSKISEIPTFLGENDIIKANSGGHPCITNISGINYLGKLGGDFLKRIAKRMLDKLSEKVNTTKNNLDETIKKFLRREIKHFDESQDEKPVEITIGSEVKWSKDGKDLNGIVEKITDKSYKICCLSFPCQFV